jgi:hypothetical protein
VQERAGDHRPIGLRLTAEQRNGSAGDSNSAPKPRADAMVGEIGSRCVAFGTSIPPHQLDYQPAASTRQQGGRHLRRRMASLLRSQQPIRT